MMQSQTKYLTNSENTPIPNNYTATAGPKRSSRLFFWSYNTKKHWHCVALLCS